MTANPDSVVLKLSVTDSSAADATNLANALSDDFVRMVKDLETPIDGGMPVARAVVIKSAASAVWVSPDRRKTIGFGVLAGLVLGGVAALLQGLRKPVAKIDVADPQVESHPDGVDVASSGAVDDAGSAGRESRRR